MTTQFHKFERSGYQMQCCYSPTFISGHWLPAAESTTSTLCTNGYPYKVLLPYLQTCDGEWWGGRCAGVCGRRGSGPPILNGVLWVGQSTQVSWRRPGDPDCSSCGQWLQWNHLWRFHCSKGRGTFIVSMCWTNVYVTVLWLLNGVHGMWKSNNALKISVWLGLFMLRNLETALAGGLGQMSLVNDYQTFRPNLGTSSVVARYMAWWLIYW